MILKGSQRGGAKALATHLLRLDENDHVEVHEIRGFVGQNLQDALREAWAVSQGTKCQQFLFSLSLNPPDRENVSVAEFEQAIEEAEKRLGLGGQPRVIVFHEKRGRRHAHCVWSRIEPNRLRSINLPLFKRKLNDLGRELYIKHGWEMPRGFLNSVYRNPLNFSLAEWQQAKRVNKDAAQIKQVLQTCWAASDSRKAFERALEGCGYYLAQGDRRGYVAVSLQGEVFSLSRWCDVIVRDLGARLGDPAKLPTVDDLKPVLVERLRSKVSDLGDELTAKFKVSSEALAARRSELVLRQRGERQFLRDVQAARWVAETGSRAARFRRGLKGLWDRLTGRHKTTRLQNESEAAAAKVRDQAEREEVIRRQLSERRQILGEIRTIRVRQRKEETELTARLGLAPEQEHKPARPREPRRRTRRPTRSPD